MTIIGLILRVGSFAGCSVGLICGLWANDWSLVGMGALALALLLLEMRMQSYLRENSLPDGVLAAFREENRMRLDGK